MAIKDLLKRTSPETETAVQTPDKTKPDVGRSNFFYDIKHKIHGRLVQEANLAALDTLDPSEIRSEIESVVEYYLKEEKALLNDEEQKHLVTEILDELMGLGPLEPFFKDPTISDVLVNTYNQIYVERFVLL